MTATIQIGGKEVRLRYSAGIPRLYRIKFKRDIFNDLKKISEKKDDTEEISIEDLSIIENVAYIMAKHADYDEDGKSLNTVPSTVEEWLEEFDGVFDVYNAMPKIFELWGLNTTITSSSKKKQEKQPEK